MLPPISLLLFLLSAPAAFLSAQSPNMNDRDGRVDTFAVEGPLANTNSARV